MKRQITEAQYSKVNEKLWENPPTIEEMTAFLEGRVKNLEVAVDPLTTYPHYWHVSFEGSKDYRAEVLCDALWEAVKDVLTGFAQ